MKQYQIKWTKGDFIRLGQAVALFNRTIKKHTTKDNQKYIPEQYNYQELKNLITTRAEFNRILNSLKSITKADAFDIHIDESGTKYIKWEWGRLQQQKRIAIKNIREDIKEYYEPKFDGMSKAEMGSMELRTLQAREQDILNFEGKTGQAKQRTALRISKYGRLDLSMYRSIIYRQNYMNVLERYSHLDNYDILIKTLNNIKNPVSFYNFMKNNELTEDLTYQSDQHYTQQAFNSYIESLGINLEFDSIS